MLYRLIRPLLYLLDAERAHHLMFGLLRLGVRAPVVGWLVRAAFRARSDPRLRVEVLGRTFPSPIGLAAGFDKNAEGIDALGALGFGFVEVGTVTAHAQPGNPRPRLFRLLEDRALVNRMGFNNEGSARVAPRLARPRDVVVGVNIGKTKATPDEAAVADYVASAERLGAHADYFVVNVSSPNTPGLRDLQAVGRLEPLLAAVRAALDRAVPTRRVPLLVKIAPDLSDDDVDAVADLALRLALDGIIATNTTIGRVGLATPEPDVVRVGAGGLSGAPLRARSLEVLRRLRRRVGAGLVLVGVGGITTPEDAYERIRAGATLVQVYSALIYEGPGLPRALARGLSRLLAADGHASVAQAVGRDALLTTASDPPSESSSERRAP